jgi:predicted deacylase
MMDPEDIPLIDELDVTAVPPGEIRRYRLRLGSDPLGRAIWSPVLVARGAEPGPTFGITAAVHGNEVNGIRVIQQLFRDIDPASLRGALVGVPVVNTLAFLELSRTFGADGFDLNRVMPGRANGNAGQVYAHRVLHRLIAKLDYLVDLHTASFGRVNSLYVRADLSHGPSRELAMQQSPEIIVHNEARDGTLRDAAMEIGVVAITVEVGDPLRFQRKLIRSSLVGLENVLDDVGMLDNEDAPREHDPVICIRSYWVYAAHSGVLEVIPGTGDHVAKGEIYARIRNVFGDEMAVYRAEEDAVVVGKSTNPICSTGARVIHLGIPGPLPPLRDDGPTPPTMAAR